MYDQHDSQRYRGTGVFQVRPEAHLAPFDPERYRWFAFWRKPTPGDQIDSVSSVEAPGRASCADRPTDRLEPAVTMRTPAPPVHQTWPPHPLVARGNRLLVAAITVLALLGLTLAVGVVLVPELPTWRHTVLSIAITVKSAILLVIAAKMHSTLILGKGRRRG